MSLSLPQIAHKGIPVVLTDTLAQVYEVKPHQIRKNFSANKDRFIEGKHYFTLSGNDLKEFKNCANVVWLCCSSGCLSHMTSDKHLFYDMLKKSLSHAEASLTMAKQAVTMCLTLKSRVDFHSI